MNAEGVLSHFHYELTVCSFPPEIPGKLGSWVRPLARDASFGKLFSTLSTKFPKSNLLLNGLRLSPICFSSRNPESWLKVLPTSSTSRLIHHLTPQEQYGLHIGWLPSSINCVRKFPYTSLTIKGRDLTYICKNKLSTTFRFPCFHVRWQNLSPGLFEEHTDNKFRPKSLSSGVLSDFLWSNSMCIIDKSSKFIFKLCSEGLRVYRYPNQFLDVSPSPLRPDESHAFLHLSFTPLTASCLFSWEAVFLNYIFYPSRNTSMGGLQTSSSVISFSNPSLSVPPQTVKEMMNPSIESRQDFFLFLSARLFFWFLLHRLSSQNCFEEGSLRSGSSIPFLGSDLDIPDGNICLTPPLRACPGTDTSPFGAF